MLTKFGPEAQNGDYVIVLDVNYIGRKANNYIARIYNGIAYTGEKMYSKDKFIHKKIAEVVIPETIVPQEVKDKIYEDIKLHNPNDILTDEEVKILSLAEDMGTWFDEIQGVEENYNKYQAAKEKAERYYSRLGIAIK